MLSESDRRLLTKACGLCWHVKNPYVKTENGTYLFSPYCKECGEVIYKDDWYYGGLIDNFHHDFTTPDDWELVRVKVVHSYLNDCIDYIIDKRVSIADPPRQLCEVTCNWIKSRPDLFPWVVEMVEVNV